MCMGPKQHALHPQHNKYLQNKKMLVLIESCNIPELLKYTSPILIITIKQGDIMVSKAVFIFYLFYFSRRI